MFYRCVLAIGIMFILSYGIHGHRQRGAGGRPPWIFIHDANIVEA